MRWLALHIHHGSYDIDSIEGDASYGRMIDEGPDMPLTTTIR